MLIGDESDDLAFKFELPVILEVKVLRFREGSSLVKDDFFSFLSGFLPVGDLVVQVPRYGKLGDLGDGISWYAPALHGDNPVVDRQFFILVEEVCKLLLLVFVSGLPAVVLGCDDRIEAFVVLKLPVELAEVLLVLLEKLQQALYLAQLVPPVVFLQDCKYSTQDIAAVGPSSHIAG